nr:PIN domain-containing protein [Paracidobacterium acidisoli]
MDTNILAYAEGVNGVSDAAKRSAARDLIDRLPSSFFVLPVQVLGELFQILIRKGGHSPADARGKILDWSEAFSVAETSATVLPAAADLVVDHRFSLWDAVILSVAAEAGCSLLLSEDMQDGFVWRGVTIVNPFSSSGHSRLKRLFDLQDR